MSARTYLLVIPWPSHYAGGVNVVVQNLALTLCSESDLRPVIAVDVWGEASPRVGSDGDLVFQFSVLAGGFLGLLKSVLALPRRLLGLWRYLRHEAVEVVNFHYVTSASFGVALLKSVGLYRGRLVLSFHGEDAKWARSWLERMAVRFAIRQADALIAVSRGLAGRVARAFNLPAEHVSVIYNGVDHQVFHPAAYTTSSRVLSLPTPFIVSISSYIPRKNLGCLLDAFAILADEHPELHLCVAGADGPEREPLLARAEELGLSSRVHLLVSLSPAETAHLIARSVACVQPARAEGLPLAVLEAGAVCRPVALSRISGHEELVVHDESGLFFPSDEPRACALAIQALLSDPQRAERMACALHARTLAEFTWRRCVTGYLHVLGLRESSSVTAQAQPG